MAARHRAVQARPAASLIAIWRDGDGAPFVFMGKRHENLRFLPGVIVFPGGKVERMESAPGVGLDIASKQELAFERPHGPSPEALASTALRECFEETGLDAAPHIEGQLRYIARAITPPHLPVRYDTHFLVANLARTNEPPLPIQAGDGELIAPAWYGAAQLAEHKLHHVTRHVLDFCMAQPEPISTAMQARTLVADRRPKRWRGQDPLRSRQLREASTGKP